MRIMQTMKKRRRIDISEAVGGGYGRFWYFRGRYRVVKGSRASKKSKTAALWFIYHLCRYPLANLLVVRRTYASLERSCYAELKWACARLGVEREFEFRSSPLLITRRSTGQRIYFKGLDDPMKLTSITVERGVLCWVWCEEAFEIESEEDFNVVDELIRGRVPDGYWKQITLTFNPWSASHWLKRRFFDAPSPDVLAITTTYRCNEFLDRDDIAMFETMRRERPGRYRVAGLGEWGVEGGLIYGGFEIAEFDVAEISGMPSAVSVFGLDFGYTNDPSALFCGIWVRDRCELYVFDEIYERALTNDKLAALIDGKGYGKERIAADSAEPKSIEELRRLGIRRITAAKKGAGSVMAGIDLCMRQKITVHPRCRAFIREISSYAWRTDASGAPVNAPEACDDHLMDAMRYAMTAASSAANYSFG